MPVDRTLAEDLTRTLVDLYSDLEQQIVADIARRLKAGTTGPDWAGQKLASINDLRNAIQHLIRRLDTDTTGVVEQTIALAFARGGTAALDELAKAGGLTPKQLAAIRGSLPGAEAINRLAWSLASTLRGTHLRILRWGLDAYRDVIATSALPQVLSGTTTRLAASQHAWDRLVSQGITGFVDKAGRRWQLTSYVEMATRTGVAQAAVQGHLDRLGAAGIDLVIASDAPQECELCRPWEGKVLDRMGPGGRHTVEVEHATIDKHMVRVEVAGSVVEAIMAGFLHPNCRHSISAYLPGITKIPTNTADPQGDKARQQQRALERGIRKAKTQAAAALSPAEAQRHEAKVRDLQADLREHLKQHPELRRLRYREQIGAGNIPPGHARPQPTPPAPTPQPTPKPAPVQPPLPEPSASERLAELVAQTPASTRKLSGGQTAHTDLVTYEGGEKLVHKVHDEVWYGTDAHTMTDAEVLGAAVLTAVGVRAPAVHKAGPVDVWLEYIDGKVGAEFRVNNRGDIRPDLITGDDGRLLGLADVLISNMDRNSGNWLVDPDGRLAGIDHGAAYRNEVSTSRFGAYLVDGTEDEDRTIKPRNDYTAADMARLHDRLVALKPQFEALGRGKWFAQMMDRHALLQRAAHGATDRIV